MDADEKMLPYIREGVEIIKLAFFKKLRDRLSEKYPDKDVEYVNKLSGAVVNELFGAPNPEEPFASFAESNQKRIRHELENLAADFDEMRAPLTDALRMQYLCDYQEGMESESLLEQAKELEVLIVHRDAPLPGRFMEFVREWGREMNLLG